MVLRDRLVYCKIVHGVASFDYLRNFQNEAREEMGEEEKAEEKGEKEGEKEQNQEEEEHRSTIYSDWETGRMDENKDGEEEDA